MWIIVNHSLSLPQFWTGFGFSFYRPQAKTYDSAEVARRVASCLVTSYHPEIAVCIEVYEAQ